MAKKKSRKKQVDALVHEDAKRKNIPTAEYESVVDKETRSPIEIAYARRNCDLDPQLVWRGKDEQDWSDLIVHAPPLYIQEKVHPKVLIDDLLRRTEKDEQKEGDQLDLFNDFNGLPSEEAKTEFYQHDANWANRMILGDSLQVMASLAVREKLGGKVQCIYIDPPYGIRFNSNFQWSTTSRDVKDGKTEHITREPEMVKAFRDTWRDGIHSYLTYLRDRLTVSRDLLNKGGSIFVQIGDENVHRVRSLLDEVFGDENFVSSINFRSMSPLGATNLTNVYDHILWYAKDKTSMKYRNIYQNRDVSDEPEFKFKSDESGYYWDANRDNIDLTNKDLRTFKRSVLMSSGFTPTCFYDFAFEGKMVSAANKSWRTHADGMQRLIKSSRLIRLGKSVYYRQYHDDFGLTNLENTWTDTAAGFSETKTYVVQTHPKIIHRCVLMTTDPGDLVLDPTCGSGTTAHVAEQWGRRWITIDTSRVALALTRARIMGAKFPFYLLSDSESGQQKEATLTRTAKSQTPTFGSIRHGFVYERKSRVYLKDIANNKEIDVIWEEFQNRLESLREKLNNILGTQWEEWEIPRELDSNWNSGAKKLHQELWDHRINRQKEIDASIAAKADSEFLYDKPYEDKKKVRVAGPFTVESLSPHRVLGVDEEDELIDASTFEGPGKYGEQDDFATMILENLRTAGVQQAHKEDRINFSSLEPWPGDLVCAVGSYTEGEEEEEKRAAIFIGPEFGTVARADLVAVAREAGDADFDVLITCAFNYEARTTEFDKLGRLPVLKARMNADLHMAEELKNTGSGNLFVIFGEPDIDLLDTEDGKVHVKVNGVDVFKPQLGRVESSNTDEIACWFIDTDYNEESFFVRHAYFLGANDPYKSLKTTLKTEINREAWETLHSDTSRPFEKPASGRIAVKVINHLGDEVMKVFRV